MMCDPKRGIAYDTGIAGKAPTAMTEPSARSPDAIVRASIAGEQPIGGDRPGSWPIAPRQDHPGFPATAGAGHIGPSLKSSRARGHAAARLPGALAP